MVSGAAEWVCSKDEIWIPYSRVIAPNENNNLPECRPSKYFKAGTRSCKKTIKLHLLHQNDM